MSGCYLQVFKGGHLNCGSCSPFTAKCGANFLGIGSEDDSAHEKTVPETRVQSQGAIVPWTRKQKESVYIQAGFELS